MGTSAYVLFSLLLLSVGFIVKNLRNKERQYTSALQMLLADSRRAHEVMKLVLHAPTGYFILFTDNTREKIDAVNTAFAAALGYSPTELENRTYSDLLHPEDRHPAVLEHGDATFVNRYETRTGEYITVKWRAVSTQSGVFVYNLGETDGD